MTSQEIQARAARELVKYETAKAIRELLDKAAKEYGEDWDADDVESQVIELVTE